MNALEAILTEEQIHLNFAVANGGTPATTQFSFPNGHDTFRQRHLFLQTQQLAEELTNGALLAWINDMAGMGQPRLAQIGGELMQVEGGHRVVGRVIMDAQPWDDWGLGLSHLNLLASWMCQQWSRRLASLARSQAMTSHSGR